MGMERYRRTTSSTSHDGLYSVESYTPPTGSTSLLALHLQNHDVVSYLEYLFDVMGDENHRGAFPWIPSGL